MTQHPIVFIATSLGFLEKTFGSVWFETKTDDDGRHVFLSSSVVLQVSHFVSSQVDEGTRKTIQWLGRCVEPEFFCVSSVAHTISSLVLQSTEDAFA